jgi:hypothetical protein
MRMPVTSAAAVVAVAATDRRAASAIILGVVDDTLRLAADRIEQPRTRSAGKLPIPIGLDPTRWTRFKGGWLPHGGIRADALVNRPRAHPITPDRQTTGP